MIGALKEFNFISVILWHCPIAAAVVYYYYHHLFLIPSPYILLKKRLCFLEANIECVSFRFTHWHRTPSWKGFVMLAWALKAMSSRIQVSEQPYSSLFTHKSLFVSLWNFMMVPFKHVYNYTCANALKQQLGAYLVGYSYLYVACVFDMVSQISPCFSWVLLPTRQKPGGTAE